MSDDHTPAETEAVADAAIEMMEALKAENASLKEQVLRFAAEHQTPVSTPMMGERVDMQAPQEYRRWWQREAETDAEG